MKIDKEEIDVPALEAEIIKHAGQETLDAIKRRAADLRAEHIETGFAPLYKQISDLGHYTDDVQAEMSRNEFEHQMKAGANVHDQPSYESYLKERQILIDALAAIEKQAHEQIEKQSATAKIMALTVERQKRDGGTIMEAERVIRLENPDLVQAEIMEAAK
jgi:hypothetical protein